MPCQPLLATHPASRRTISLYAADPDLVRSIPAPDVPMARRALVAPRLDLFPGDWRPSPPPAGEAASSLLVTGGLLARSVRIGDCTATQLLGPGDVLHTSADGREDRHRVEWVVHEPATVAVLGARFDVAARRWPCLTAEIQRRMHSMAARLAAHIAICQLARVDQRVMALLWELADRFGRVTPQGVVLDLRLTHALLGQLVGAKRPTVTLAVGTLMDEGLLGRRADGAWLLHHDAVPASAAA